MAGIHEARVVGATAGLLVLASLSPRAVATAGSGSAGADRCTPVDVIVRPCGPLAGGGVDTDAALLTVRLSRVRWSVP